MNYSSLVFDFDGWKLNGVAIGEEVSKLSFLGEEDPPEKSQPGTLEQIINRWTGKKPKFQTDMVLEYAKTGLMVEFDEGKISGYSFFVKASDTTGYDSFKGHFVNAGQPISLTPYTTTNDIIEMFGKPPEDELDDLSSLIYENGDYELAFWFDDDKQLTHFDAMYYFD